MTIIRIVGVGRRAKVPCRDGEVLITTLMAILFDFSTFLYIHISLESGLAS